MDTVPVYTPPEETKKLSRFLGKFTNRRTILIVGAILVLFGAGWLFRNVAIDFFRGRASDIQPTLVPIPRAIPPPVVCKPDTQNAQPEQLVVLTATGGTGSYEWYAPKSNQLIGKGTNFSVSYPHVPVVGTTVITRSILVISATRTDRCDVVVQYPACQPRPACLNLVPSCDIPEPAGGWCPILQ